VAREISTRTNKVVKKARGLKTTAGGKKRFSSRELWRKGSDTCLSKSSKTRGGNL